ncbi:MAG: trypsin-like peptidase domain-containing protein, partial [Victivallales bacterium]|nr:trypsin-like peptidase domain-containing protein [Victivallales bacterium]
EVYPALVYIRVNRSAMESSDEDMEAVRGSGVLISANGEVLTNHHVIEKAREIRCLLADGRNRQAEVVGSDEDLDVALLQLKLEEGESVPSARLRSSGVQVGDFVMALGAPLGLTRTVTIGIISSAQRFLSQKKSQYNTWYQTDATLFPGNSGGPLIDIHGEVIGLNTLGRAGSGMGFALPSVVLLDILPRLREYHAINWAWLGFQFQPLHDFENNTYFPYSEGVMIADTDPGSPARLAGVRSGDRLLAFNGIPVTAVNQEEIPDLNRRFALLPLEAPVEFLLERADGRYSVTLTPQAKGSIREEQEFPQWGFTAKEINRAEHPTLHFYAPEGGVFIASLVNEESYSYRSNELKRNDILISINGADVHSLAELQAVYEQCVASEAPGKKLPVVILRGGRRRQLFIQLRDKSDNQED